MIPEAIITRRRRWKLHTALLTITLPLTILFSTCIGSSFIPASEVFKALLKPMNSSIVVESIYEQIVLAVRLPRVLMGCVVGSSLSLAGALLQGMFRNPMADPYVIGVSSGAALGAALAMLLGFGFTFLGTVSIPVTAFIFAMLTLMTVYNISRVGGRVPVMTLLLSGIALGIFLSAITSLLATLNPSKLHGWYFWVMGTLSMAEGHWDYVLITLPILTLCSAVAYFYARDLNIMLMGEETALTLGVDVERVKLTLIVISSLVTSIAVSFTGMIAFVGLMVPHITRLIVGPDHRVLLPCSTLFGAMFLILCDDVARTAFAPVQIPVGIVTALAGGPFFVYLLRKKRREYSI